MSSKMTLKHGITPEDTAKLWPHVRRDAAMATEDEFYKKIGVLSHIGPSTTGVADNGDIVGVGGIFVPSPGVGHCWTALHKDIPNYAKFLFLFCNEFIERERKLLGLHRLEAIAEKKYATNLTFLEKLGLEYEGTLKGYGRDKGDFVIYGKLYED